MAWDGLIKNRGGKKKQTNNENQIRNLYAVYWASQILNSTKTLAQLVNWQS